MTLRELRRRADSGVPPGVGRVPDTVLRGLAAFDPWMWLRWQAKRPATPAQAHGEWVLMRRIPAAAYDWEVHAVPVADMRLIEWLWWNDLERRFKNRKVRVKDFGANEMYRDRDRQQQDALDDGLSYYRRLLHKPEGALTTDDWNAPIREMYKERDDGDGLLVAQS